MKDIQKQTTWEERFDDRFPHLVYPRNYVATDLKTFISDEIQRAKTEEREAVLQEVEEIVIEKDKEFVTDEEYWGDTQVDANKYIHAQNKLRQRQREKLRRIKERKI